MGVDRALRLPGGPGGVEDESPRFGFERGRGTGGGAGSGAGGGGFGGSGGGGTGVGGGVGTPGTESGTITRQNV